MIETLTIAFRIAGAGLILLALLHIPMSRNLRWREDVAQHQPPQNSRLRSQQSPIPNHREEAEVQYHHADRGD